MKHILTPILCVGEPQRDTTGNHFQFVREQVLESLGGIPRSALARIVIAYEPVWAIGKDAVRGATPEEAEEMIIFIKKVISEHFNLKTYPETQMLYGGSVDSKNAEAFLERSVVDGFLVGRASLDSKNFSEILRIGNSNF